MRRDRGLVSGSALLLAFLLPSASLLGGEVESTDLSGATAKMTAASEPAPTRVTTKLVSPNPSCPVRDPEDGGCFLTADAADRAWLLRGGMQVPPPTPAELAALKAASPAAPPKAAKPDALASFDNLAADEDEGLDADDSEDGGHLAPIDSLLPADRRLPSLDDIRASQKPTFWKSLASSIKGVIYKASPKVKPISLPEDELIQLFSTGFPLPMQQFSFAKFRDSFNSPRGRHRRHHAIDLPADPGTPIVAVADGVVQRLGWDRRGGRVVYLRDVSGRFMFYYAHLSKHADGLAAGDRVKKGQVLGAVGNTGRSTGPHLHFAIFREAEETTSFKRLVVNPYLVFSAMGFGKR